MSVELTALVDLIASQIRVIEDICSANNTTVPPINDPNPMPGLTANPNFMQAADITIAAALRLIASLYNPHMALQRVASGMYGSALLNVAVEANITEALKEAGPEGLHVKDLAVKVNMDHGRLGRVLRYLCAVHNTYREVSPNVFANNRLSAALDTGKPFNEIKDRGPLRYTGSRGCAAIIGHITDGGLKGAAHLPSVILDPDMAVVEDGSKSAVMKAVGFNGNFYKWMEQDGNEKRLSRFGVAMTNTENIFPKELIVSLFAWNTLPKGDIVVDVGGGLGGSTLPLCQAFPNLHFIIQDRPPVIADAEKHWKKVFPAALESGLVELQSHNFFESQPIKDASVFILRFILHNWPDSDSIKILQRLRASAKHDTKVVILEQIVPYACPIEDSALTGKIPEVLQGNLAAGLGLPYHLDIQMLNSLNAKQRTIGEWTELVGAGGFKVQSVNPGIISSIICTPG